MSGGVGSTAAESLPTSPESYASLPSSGGTSQPGQNNSSQWQNSMEYSYQQQQRLAVPGGSFSATRDFEGNGGYSEGANPQEIPGDHIRPALWTSIDIDGTSHRQYMTEVCLPRSCWEVR